MNLFARNRAKSRIEEKGMRSDLRGRSNKEKRGGFSPDAMGIRSGVSRMGGAIGGVRLPRFGAGFNSPRALSARGGGGSPVEANVLGAMLPFPDNLPGLVVPAFFLRVVGAWEINFIIWIPNDENCHRGSQSMVGFQPVGECFGETSILPST